MSQYLCPECQVDSNVIDTRPSYNRLRRRRVCKNGHKFSTIEVPMNAPELIVDLMTWASQNDMSDPDMVAYLRDQVRETMLGLTEQEEPDG
jgi:transcriptional regulator NrdR family protein